MSLVICSMEEKLNQASGAAKNQLVQFVGFRCMAFLDESGKWRSAYDGRELPGFLFIVAE